MQTGWSKYLFNFGSPLRENGALHKHRLQSSFAHSWPSYSQQLRSSRRISGQVRARAADSKVGACWERPMSIHETCRSATRMRIAFLKRFTDSGVILVAQRSETRDTLPATDQLCLSPLSISPCFLWLSAVNYPTKAKMPQKKCYTALVTDECTSRRDTQSSSSLLIKTQQSVIS